MKFFISFILFLFYSHSLQAQNNLAPILKAYFRTHPFDIRFTSFISSLQTDPWFTTEIMDRRSDTSFFFMSGTYKNFNPFQFGVKEVRLTISEDQFIHSDSLQTEDTLINIQMMGILDAKPANQLLVKKEYTRFQKKYSSLFWKKNYSKNEKEAKLIWEMTNYFLYPFSISPVTIAWGHIQETAEYLFSINIRCKVKQNEADFILSPDER